MVGTTHIDRFSQTTHNGDVLTTLGRFAHAEEPQAFAALVDATDWVKHTPEELLQAIDFALYLELATLAETLAQQGRAIFPEHEAVQRAAHVLAPPVARRVTPNQPARLDASRTWLRMNAEKYRHQWVAVRNGVLLAAAPTLQQLKQAVEAQQNDRTTLITKVL